MQVMPANVVAHAVDAPLQISEVAFDGIGGDTQAAFKPDVLLCVVVDLAVPAALARPSQNGAAVRYHVRGFINHLFNDGLGIRGGCSLDMNRLNTTAALKRRSNGSLVGTSRQGILGPLALLQALRADAKLSADVGFVNLHNTQ